MRPFKIVYYFVVALFRRSRSEGESVKANGGTFWTKSELFLSRTPTDARAERVVA
jgi:hypothetical protein